MRATNFALDEIVNWSDFTSETDRSGPNNLGYTVKSENLDGTFSSSNWLWLELLLTDEFFNLPRTFLVFANETQQRQIAIEIEDLVGSAFVDSDA